MDILFKHLHKYRDSTFLITFSTFLALFLANSFLKTFYVKICEFVIYIPVLNIRLSLSDWIADGLLAIFFFSIGLELKYEFLVTNSKKISSILLPTVAATLGVVFPALIYILINNLAETPNYAGWATPTATDIAFAISILAIISPKIPAKLKNFLLTLAVVDDLLAILIIIFKFSSNINLIYLLFSLLPLALFYLLISNGETNIFIILPLSIIFWILFEKAHIHPTIAGVILGLIVPMKSQSKDCAKENINHYLHSRIESFSSLIVIPIFAFVSAGVNIGGIEGFKNSISSPITIGVLFGLLLGKPLALLLVIILAKYAFKSNYFEGMKLYQIITIACLAGVGFTVSLLISKLSFTDAYLQQDAKIGILLGSFFSIILAIIVVKIGEYKSFRQ